MADNYYLEHTGAQLDEAIRKVLSGELDVPMQEKTITPSTSKQIVFPDANYKGLSRVTVEAIPQSYTDEVYNQGYEDAVAEWKPYEQELEYIQSTGTQYFDTELVVNKSDTYEYEIDALFTSSSWGGTNGYMQFNSSISLNNRAKIKVVYNGATHVESIYVNNELVSSTDWSNSYSGTDVKIGILKMGDANDSWYTSDPQIGKIYSLYVRKNNILIRDYIPVLDWNGVACLYDKVNRKMTYNSGTGLFLSNVYTKLKYIESTGTQFIDTGVAITPNNARNIKCVIDKVILSTGKYALDGTGYSVSPYFNSFYVGINASSKIAYGDGRADKVSTLTYDGTRKVFTYSGEGKVSVTGLSDISFTFTPPGASLNFFLFGYSQSATTAQKYSGRIYSCQIYENGVLLRDYIPVLDSSGVPCLYDNVNKTFTYNSGTGSFTYA